MAYSVDLRERVVAACDAGEKPEEVGPRFSVCVRTVYYWLSLRKETGEVIPRAGDRGPEPKLAKHSDRLSELVRKRPDATLGELRSGLRVEVGIETIRRALLSLGLSFKKEGHPRRRAGARGRTAKA